MSITFRPAVRESVALLIGLAGASGSGKTYSAMRLASGIAAGKPFAVIDTESRRALHYVPTFAFDHAELRPPFTPARFAEAILEADKAGYPAIVVDSMSLEYAGEGGVLDMQEDDMQRMAGDDWAKRERVKMASWIRAKMEHKKMVQRLLQVKSHLILCFRAEEKIEIIKDEHGKTKIVPKQTITGAGGWIPITEKSLPYELTVSLLLTPDHPGIPRPIKLQDQHKALFPLDKPITEESGRLIAQWASGGTKINAGGVDGHAPGVGQADARGPGQQTGFESGPAPTVDVVLRELRAASLEGTATLSEKWQAIGKEMRHALAEQLPSLKEAAARAATPIGDAR